MDYSVQRVDVSYFMFDAMETSALMFDFLIYQLLAYLFLKAEVPKPRAAGGPSLSESGPQGLSISCNVL